MQGVGASFALLELRTVLAQVVARARLGPASKRPERVGRRGVTLAPSGGALAMLRERRGAQEPAVA